MFIENLTPLSHLLKLSSRLDFGTCYPPYRSRPQCMRVQHFCMSNYNLYIAIYHNENWLVPLVRAGSLVISTG